MRRFSIAGGILAVSFLAAPARADFDAEAGVARIDPASIGFGFEDGANERARVARVAEGEMPTIGGPVPAEWRAPGAIEGARAVRVPQGSALVVGDGDTFGPVHGQRVELRFWARADGAEPSGRLVYASGEAGPQELAFPTASIDAIETGRATSDGWVEYATGPVDAAVGSSTRLAAIVFEAAMSPSATSGFFVDAVEVLSRGALPARPKTCSLATEDAVCGADGACVEGLCADSALVWGALPSKEQRLAIVARQEQYFERVSSDRYGASRSTTLFAPAARAAAEAATTPRTFWQPFQRAAALARGAHTRAAGPPRFHRLSWQALTYTRSYWNELLACFGVVERDLTGGGRGFAVFQSAPASPLRVGDVVETIDGEDPRAWLARAIPMTPLSSDPDVDDPLQGAALQELVAALAQTLEVTRCAGPAACTGASATKVNVDVAALRRAARMLPGDTQPRCSVRFQLPVDVPAGADVHAYEAAFESVDAEGFVNVLTNGEPPGSTLAGVVNKAFDRQASRMLVDKRRGDGGGGESLMVWAERVRQDESFRLLSVARWTADAIDPPASVFGELAQCDSRRAAAPACWGLDASWFGIPAQPKPRPAKIAWLNLVDGSASDMAATYAKGVSGVRIFAPARTMGLFGGLHHLPRFGNALSDSYVQRSDTRIGSTWDAVTAAPWQSGTGIEPDERVVQTLGDLLAGKDTMLERARAWLRDPN